MPDYQAILDFWFGGQSGNIAIAREKEAQWWGKDVEQDKRIKQLFESLLDDAVAGKLNHWKTEPRGTLALIILLDQFSRNMYRGTERAFSQDELALALAQEGVELGVDKQLSLIQRVFFYMPFEHAENRELQAQSVDLFRKLASEATEDEKALFESNLDYAIQHQLIVERFGRFPHRNDILKRQSAKEEIAFLKEPGSSF